MARQPKLKVYRLPVGFHDAYVAAPSQKAAIEAWGSDKDVFQRGQAELVEDPKLTKEPLASPGEVIKRLRGTAAEQMAALGKAEPAPRRKSRRTSSEAEPEARARSSARATPSARAKPQPKPQPAPRPRPPPKPKPRPSRGALDKAEQALAEAEERHQQDRRKIAEREAALARERKALEKKQADERERLEVRRDKAEAAYDEAMRRWRAS
jgi:hypothetical protein